MIIETLDPNSPVVLFTGDRHWWHLPPVLQVLETLAPETVIVHGWADGLDTVVDVAATEMGFRVIRCPAHWRHNEAKCVKVWGPCPVDCDAVVRRPAGVIRNHQMFYAYHPTKVFGFHDNILESKGTKDMVTFAMKSGVIPTVYNSAGEIVSLEPLTKPKKSRTLNALKVDKWFKIEKK